MNQTFTLDGATTLGVSDDGYAIIRVPIETELDASDLIEDPPPSQLCAEPYPYACQATALDSSPTPLSSGPPMPPTRSTLPREAAVLYHRLDAILVELVGLLEGIEQRFEIPE